MPSTDPTDLLAFLRDRYDEDEADARAATAEIEAWGDSWQAWCDAVERRTIIEAEAIADHMERHDPASVLADIAAKRAILDLHGIIWRDVAWLERDGAEIVEGGAELPVCEHCVPRHSSFPTRHDVPEGPCLTVRLLASAYAHHEGYRRDWRPS